MQLFSKGADAGVRQVRITSALLSANIHNMARHLIKRSAQIAHRGYRITAWIFRALLKLLPPGLEMFLHHEFGARYFSTVAASFSLFLFYRYCALQMPHVCFQKY